MWQSSKSQKNSLSALNPLLKNTVFRLCDGNWKVRGQSTIVICISLVYVAGDVYDYSRVLQGKRTREFSISYSSRFIHSFFHSLPVLGAEWSAQQVAQTENLNQQGAKHFQVSCIIDFITFSKSCVSIDFRTKQLAYCRQENDCHWGSRTADPKIQMAGLLGLGSDVDSLSCNWK